MSKRFFSTQRYLQKRNELVTPSTSKKGRREWVIARGLCYYRLFVLHDIPATRQETVLQLKIQQWSPFQDFGSYYVWQGDQVQVWIWDKLKQQNLFTEAGIKQATVIPETVLYNRQITDATLLNKCLDGFEGQIWRDSLLVGSRWWAQIPETREWINFQRMQGLAVNNEIPTVCEEPLQERPWQQKKNYAKHFNLFQESLIVTIGATVLTILLSWQITQILIWQQALEQVQAEVNELEDEITPILAARTLALENKTHFEHLLTINSYPSQIEMLTLVTEKLPDREEAKLLEWFYQMGKLRFIIEVKKVDPAFYIKALQTVPLFTEIKAQIGKGKGANRIVINMIVND